MKHFDIITLFPETIIPYSQASILGRAQKKKLIAVKAHDLRSFSKDKHGKVDDTPYGGGAGMVMAVQPIDAAVRKIRRGAIHRARKTRVIVTSASGKTFTQKDAKRLAKYDQIIFICGRYEGIDARVEAEIADEALSIGDYVLTGGEIPAMVMVDTVVRLLPGVIKPESLSEESFSLAINHQPLTINVEYPQYTRPENYKGWKVPEILLSGNHQKINSWRQELQSPAAKD